ncbi:exosome component Rrp46 [Panaeolus papilionaceus]|nr:exosome component Rrp46 [Panaeolus papilionaceus]
MATSTRHDGRSNDQPRKESISFDKLARVDGSARFSFGNTSALASISGPIEVRLAAEQPTKATFEVQVRPLSNVPGTDAKAMAASIRSSLEPALILTKNPRSLVQLVIQAVSSTRSAAGTDSLLAAMINASTTALLDAASVPMRGIVFAIAIGRLPNGTLVVDAGEDEEERLEASGCFAFLFAGEVRSDCVWSSWKTRTGQYNEEELYAARQMGLEAARLVCEKSKRRFGHREAEHSLQEEVIASWSAKPQSTQQADDNEVSEDDDKMEI